MKDMLMETYNLTSDEAEAVVNNCGANKMLKESFENGDVIMADVGMVPFEDDDSSVCVHLPSGRYFGISKL